jgi:5'-deoxynucleotidase YfbR-like HD superfamily hydrolase
MRNQRRGGAVKRWHTLRTIFGQSVAEHSWGVAALALELWPDCSKTFLAACIHHDSHEAYLGDIPWTAKRNHPFLAREIKEAEASEEALMGVMPQLLEFEKHRLKTADMLELCFFCCEEIDAGNTHMYEPLENGLDFLFSHVGTEDIKVWQAIKQMKSRLVGSTTVQDQTSNTGTGQQPKDSTTSKDVSRSTYPDGETKEESRTLGKPNTIFRSISNS